MKRKRVFVLAVSLKLAVAEYCGLLSVIEK